MAQHVHDQQCFRQYQAKEEIGRGSFGAVYRTCLKGDCRYVTKVIEAKVMTSADKEIVFLRSLDSVSLVPKLYDSWYCPTTMAMFLTMEAFDGNMWELAGRAVPHAYAGKVAVCLTVPQLQRIHEIALMLYDVFNLIHADFKLDNLMQRNNGAQIVVSDFGLSGYLRHDGGRIPPQQGFTSGGSFVCDHIPELFRQYYNLFQMEMMLFQAGAVVYNGRYEAFDGFDMPWYARNHLYSHCAKSNEAFARRASLANLGLPKHTFVPAYRLARTYDGYRALEKQHFVFCGVPEEEFVARDVATQVSFIKRATRTVLDEWLQRSKNLRRELLHRVLKHRIASQLGELQRLPILSLPLVLNSFVSAAPFALVKGTMNIVSLTEPGDLAIVDALMAPYTTPEIVERADNVLYRHVLWSIKL